MNKYEEGPTLMTEFSTKSHYQFRPERNLNSFHLSHNHEIHSFISAVKEFIKNGEFENLIIFIENSIPSILEKTPKILFWCFKCIVLILKKQKKITLAEELYNKFLFPFYKNSEGFRTKINAFKVILHSQNVDMSLISLKIDKYSEKFVNLLQSILFKEFNTQLHSDFSRKPHSIRNLMGNKPLCESRYLQILSKLDIKEDDSCLSDLEDDIMKACQSGSDSSSENTAHIKYATINKKPNIFEIKKESKINGIINGPTNSNIEPKFEDQLNTKKDSMNIDNDNISKISLDKNLYKKDFSEIQSTKISLENKFNERNFAEIQYPKISLYNKFFSNSITDVNSPLENFCKFVEEDQNSKIYQPLQSIVIDTGFLETNSNSRKTSEDPMDVEGCSYERDTATIPSGIDIVKKFRQNDYINSKTFKVDPILDNCSNFNTYNKEYIPRTKPKETLKNVVPFLREFKPKFLKKENIDKKILRKFRKFVKETYNNNIDIFKEFDIVFWEKFTFANLLPPMRTEEANLRIEFKSFNTKYLIWLFSKNGSVPLYQKFSANFGEEVLQNFINDYSLINNKSEIGIIEKLKYYIFAIPEIYSKNNTLLDYCITDNYSCNLSYTMNIRSEDFLASYLGADVYTNVPNAFYLNNFGSAYPRCGKELKEKFRNYEEDYKHFESNINFADQMNASFDSIQSVE